RFSVGGGAELIDLTPILPWNFAWTFPSKSQRKKCVGVSIFPNSSRIRTDFDQIPVAPRGIDVLQQTSEFVVRNGFLVAFERLPARFGSNRTDIRCRHDMKRGNCRGQNKNSAAQRRTDHLDFAFINTMIGEC